MCYLAETGWGRSEGRSIIIHMNDNDYDDNNGALCYKLEGRGFETRRGK
jgi:hypothetical protein